MSASRSASRPAHPAVAIATVAIIALFAGLLASPWEASAQTSTKSSAGKPQKKGRGAKQIRRKPPKSHAGPSVPVASAPTSPAVGQHEAVSAPQPTTPVASMPPPPTAPPPTTPSTPTPSAIPGSSTSPSSSSAPSSPAPLLQGSNISSFWLNQSAPGAITEVPDPAGSGDTVFKFTVGDSDETQGSSPNPRGELISKPNITAGAEFWWSTKFFLPADFPAATPNFVTLLQGPFGAPTAGSPPFHIEANNGVLKWQRNATYNWDVPWQIPQVRNQWVSVLVHERFASDGFVELWINGQQITFFASGLYNPNRVAPTTRLEMATMDSTNSGGPNSLYLQQYRKKGMYPTLTTYEGPLLVGSTRASVGG